MSASYKNLFKYYASVGHGWLAVWVVIYVGFLTLGLFMPDSLPVTILKLLGIALCSAYVLQNYRKDLRLILALSFTFIADIFLACNNASAMGVFTFCLAQFFHLTRLADVKPLVFFTFPFVLLAIFLASLFLNFPAILPLAAVYAVLLFLNFYFALRWHQKSRSAHSACALIGFFLFICCDLCVATSFLSSAASPLPSLASPPLQSIANYLAWVFYYPSQIFISSSSTLGDKTFSNKSFKKVAKKLQSMLK